MDNRKAITAILYVLRTGGVSGKHYQELLVGASSTVHDRFQEWRRDMVYIQENVD
jgi:transposase